MTTSPVFDWTGHAIQDHTGLEALQARGTLRFALKEGGLDPSSVTPHEMSAVIKQLLPKFLKKSGVDDADGVCVRLGIALNTQNFSQQDQPRAAEAFFQRALTPKR